MLVYSRSFVNFCVLDDGLVGCWLIPVLECRIMNRVPGQCHDLIGCQSCIPSCAFSILAAPFMWCQTFTFEGYYSDFFNSLVLLFLLHCKMLLKLIIFTAPYIVIFLVEKLKSFSFLCVGKIGEFSYTTRGAPGYAQRNEAEGFSNSKLILILCESS